MSSKMLFFAQHGLALSKEVNSARPLSDIGMAQTAAIARHLGKIKLPPLHIYHSSKLRAVQTAEILAASVSETPRNVKQHSHLSPNDDIQLLIPELQDNALYVGHLPQLDKLCAYLLTGHESTGIIQFQNSGVICLSLREGQGQLNWYLTPEIVIAQ